MQSSAQVGCIARYRRKACLQASIMQAPQASRKCQCRQNALMVKKTHREPKIAYMAGVRWEYLCRNPCVHLILYSELMRRAEESWCTIRYLRDKASDILKKDAEEALGPVLYEYVNNFVVYSEAQLYDMLQ